MLLQTIDQLFIFVLVCDLIRLWCNMSIVSNITSIVAELKITLHGTSFEKGVPVDCTTYRMLYCLSVCSVRFLKSLLSRAGIKYIFIFVLDQLLRGIFVFDWGI